VSTPLPPRPDSAVKKRSVTLAVAGAGIAIALVAGIGIGYAAAPKTSTNEDSASPATASPASSSSTPSPPAQETSSPSPSPAGNLTKSDIELSLKTTQRQCFGSAGCNVTVEVRASVDQLVLDALPADGTWDVTYQISGDESGPIIGTFSLYGNGKYDVNEEFLSTPSENTPVRVKALDVERFQ
jgi:hypothetical protein